MKPEDDELDAELKRALSHDPGERYFQDFASRVADRIAAESRAEAARAEAARVPWWRGLLSSPRALAAVGSVAVVAVAAGIAFNVMRHPADTLAQRESALRAPAEASAPAAGAVADKASPPAETPSQPAPGLASSPESEALADAAHGAGPAATATAPSAPARMQEVRTNEAGDAVPVPNARDERVRERVAAAAPATPAQGFTELKRQAQGPLAASGSTATTGARRAAEAAPAPASPKSTVASPDTRGAERDAGALRADAPHANRAPVVDENAREESAAAAPTSLAPRGGLAPAPTGEAGALADPRSLGASGGGVAGAVGQVVDRVSKARARSPFAAEAPAVQARVDDAEARTTDARRTQTSAAWDAAASSWGALAPAVSTPAAQVEARWRAADARVRAWRAQPSPAREAAAREAVDAFRAASPRDSRLRGLSGPALPWGR